MQTWATDELRHLSKGQPVWADTLLECHLDLKTVDEVVYDCGAVKL